MECQRIRVLLDLSELKDRLHKYVWMLVSTSDLKSIADFKDAVIKKLALDKNTKNIKMFINGGLLLEEENILVLRDNDAVQIQCKNILTTDFITSCIEGQNNLISDVELSSNISDDNFNKAVERSKKKKQLSELVDVDTPTSCKKECSHKRKRKRNVVLNDSLENPHGMNLSQEESAMAFCDINEKSTYNEKKQKKSCSASIPKEDLIEENKQHNGKSGKKSAATIFHVNEDISESKKKTQTQYSETSISKDVPIQVEDDNNENVIYLESAFAVSDNESLSIKKRKSCKSSASSDAFIQNQQFERGDISIIPVEISLDDSSQEINTIQISNNDLVQSNNCKKKKRRRHRKRRSEQNLVSPFMPENFSTSPQPVKDLTTFNSGDNFSSVRKHIRFTSPKPDSKKKESEVIDLENSNQKCASEISLETSPSFNASSINETDGNDTTPAENGNSSYMNAASSHQFFDLNSSTAPPSKSNYLNELSMKNPVSTSEFEPLFRLRKHSFDHYPPLNTLPCIGTCIAFKLLELNASYSPEVSSYKEGVIKSINPKAEEIEIELTRDEIKPGRIGKFENLKEGEIPVSEVTNKVKTCWSSLIEPKLISRQ